MAQIAPVRIELLDQFDLPGAPPAFQRVFARASFKDGLERFKIYKLVEAIFASETGNKPALCSDNRRPRLLVTPIYSVPFRLLARM